MSDDQQQKPGVDELLQQQIRDAQARKSVLLVGGVQPAKIGPDGDILEEPGQGGGGNQGVVIAPPINGASGTTTEQPEDRSADPPVAVVKPGVSDTASATGSSASEPLNSAVSRETLSTGFPVDTSGEVPRRDRATARIWPLVLGALLLGATMMWAFITVTAQPQPGVAVASAEPSIPPSSPTVSVTTEPSDITSAPVIAAAQSPTPTVAAATSAPAAAQSPTPTVALTATPATPAAPSPTLTPIITPFPTSTPSPSPAKPIKATPTSAARTSRLFRGIPERSFTQGENLGSSTCVKGRVVDRKGGPIAGATGAVNSGAFSYAWTTNADGLYKACGMVAGSWASVLFYVPGKPPLANQPSITIDLKGAPAGQEQFEDYWGIINFREQ